MKIIIEDDLYITDNINVVESKIYIKDNMFCFPNNKWTDFVFPMLEEWKTNLLNVRFSDNVSFKLYFHDGPFWLEVYKTSDNDLEIECINGRTNNSEITIQCKYYEFLNCIYDAMKRFSKILFEHQMNKGKFESIYRQTLLSIRELKDIL